MRCQDLVAQRIDDCNWPVETVVLHPSGLGEAVIVVVFGVCQALQVGVLVVIILNDRGFQRANTTGHREGKIACRHEYHDY